jgi:restriction system protein
MAIPDFQSVMLPLVKILGDGQERTMREVTDLLAESFQLTDQEREELLPSGQQSLFSNRVNREILVALQHLLASPHGFGKVDQRWLALMETAW